MQGATSPALDREPLSVNRGYPQSNYSCTFSTHIIEDKHSYFQGPLVFGGSIFCPLFSFFWNFISYFAWFFSADGSYEVQLLTKAVVYYTGDILWQPPAIYKSSCVIDVEFFPYDIQTCHLKLGSWTYDGVQVKNPPQN